MKRLIEVLKLFAFGSFSILLAVSCAQKPVEVSRADKTSWETKALVKQLRTGQVNNVSIDVLAIKGSRLRMDVSATLGYRVASFVIDKNSIQALVPPEKKFYEGYVTADVIARVMKVPVHPNVFYAMIFDLGLKGQGWTCRSDEKGFIQECLFKDQISITWERLEPPQKIVHLKTKAVEMDWFFKNQDLNWEPKEEAFKLSAPDGFESIRL